MFVHHECHHHFYPKHQNLPGPVEFHFKPFDLEKAKIDEKNFKYAMIAVHGPSMIDTSNLLQVLSSGYANFLQVYVF